MTTAHPTSPALAWSFRWDMREHVRALQAATRHAAHTRWLRPLLALGLGGGLLLAAIGVYTGAPVAGGLGAGLAIMASWMLLIRWIGPWVHAWQTRRSDPAVQGEIRQTADDGGFTIHSPGQDVRLAWSGIVRVVETPEFFLVYFHRATACYSPRRAIDPETAQALRALFRRELGTRAEVGGP